MDTATIFHWYANTIWPIHKKIIKTSKRCQRCILSEKYTDIKDGICKLCREYKKTDDIPQKYSIADLTASLKRSYKYDATLLLSGGKDSAYILHRMRQDYPDFKILCLTINNGFMSPYAIKNAQYITTKLGVDLIIVNSYLQEFKSVLRKSLIDLKGQETYGVVDHADGDAIFSIGQRITYGFRIQTMIGGLSWVQLHRICNSTDFKFKSGGIEIIHPLAVWRTDEQEIREYVRRHDLMLKGSDSPMVSNSRLIPIMAVLDIKNLGYSSFEPEFAQLIREGKSSRDAWINIFEAMEYVVNKGYLDGELIRVLSELDLIPEEVL
jgi:3'-phosphoadenosine 5'-phosphosulfate sulfotransferase (PAPS reductase)/FAD synthetase